MQALLGLFFGGAAPPGDLMDMDDDRREVSGREWTGWTGHQHQQQKAKFCAVHALNNLFCKFDDSGGPHPEPDWLFKPSHLDAVAHELSAKPSGAGLPFRSRLGLGDYEVDVIETVVKRMGYRWSRAKVNGQHLDVTNLDLGSLAGIIVRTPGTWWRKWIAPVALYAAMCSPFPLCGETRYELVVVIMWPVLFLLVVVLFLVTNGPHWHVIRRDSSWRQWYNLDSRLPTPEHYEDEREVASALQRLLYEGGSGKQAVDFFFVSSRATSIYEMQSEEVGELLDSMGMGRYRKKVREIYRCCRLHTHDLACSSVGFAPAGVFSRLCPLLPSPPPLRSQFETWNSEGASGAVLVRAVTGCADVAEAASQWEKGVQKFWDGMGMGNDGMVDQALIVREFKRLMILADADRERAAAAAAEAEGTPSNDGGADADAEGEQTQGDADLAPWGRYPCGGARWPVPVRCFEGYRPDPKTLKPDLIKKKKKGKKQVLFGLDNQNTQAALQQWGDQVCAEKDFDAPQIEAMRKFIREPLKNEKNEDGRPFETWQELEAYCNFAEEQGPSFGVDTNEMLGFDAYPMVGDAIMEAVRRRPVPTVSAASTVGGGGGDDQANTSHKTHTQMTAWEDKKKSHARFGHTDFFRDQEAAVARVRDIFPELTPSVLKSHRYVREVLGASARRPRAIGPINPSDRFNPVENTKRIIEALIEDRDKLHRLCAYGLVDNDAVRRLDNADPFYLLQPGQWLIELSEDLQATASECFDRSLGWLNTPVR
eukprot:SAG22_NODE_144_length_17700_cov_21.959207_7_plen_765_part_00